MQRSFPLIIFLLHCDHHNLLSNSLLRDTMERGRSLEGSLMQYERFVYPAFKQHIEPTMQYADLVVPNGQWRAKRVMVRRRNHIIGVDLKRHIWRWSPCGAGAGNVVAMDLIISHVKSGLAARGFDLRYDGRAPFFSPRTFSWRDLVEIPPAPSSSP